MSFIRRSHKTKILLIAVFLILSLSTFSHAAEIKLKTSSDKLYFSSTGSTIHIPDHYSTIQDGIDNASPGDLIIVRKGIYEENNIVVNKSILLWGENASSTIVKSTNSEGSLLISNDGVFVVGFTFKNYKARINANNSAFASNIINSNTGTAIECYNSSGNRISNNRVYNSSIGIYLSSSRNNIISKNYITNTSRGIYLEGSNKNMLVLNTLYSNEQGVFLSYADDNLIVNNNFISNHRNAKFSIWNSPDGIQKNTWDHNHWDNSLGILPKIIPGSFFLKLKINKSLFLPWVAFDKHPEKRFLYSLSEEYSNLFFIM